ncbi:MAG: DnaJ domain-containing protein [Rhizobiales bacterium]|nr:DnaJ domain-containing protein [Hyphomicrobiales bacterium]
MSIWGKLAGAAAGLAVGGPLGALMGALAGHFAVDKQLTHGIKDEKVLFTIGVIALGAKMAKADGRVTKDEIVAFREVFQVPPEEQENVARIFNLAKQDIAGYEAYAKQIAEHFHDRRTLLENVLEGLFHIAAADGVLHPDEEAYLERVGSIFGFASDEFRRIRARFVSDGTSDPYEVLGVSPEIDDEALKSHYRRLVRENHPDLAMAEGLPQEFIQIATAKLAAINEAYETIMRSRGG